MSIVLIGLIGVGKTTLYNKITNSNEKVLFGNNATKSSIMKKSCYGSGFLVIDTPGLGSMYDKIQANAGIIAALRQGPVNRIAIVVKYDRVDVMIQNFKNIFSRIDFLKVSITVIISYWDCCQSIEQLQVKKQIQDKFQAYQITSIFYFGKLDTAESICKQIDQIIKQSPPKQIILSNDDIYRNFDFLNDGGEEFIELKFELSSQRGNYDNNIRKQIKVFRTLDNKSDQFLQILQYTTVYLLKQNEEFLEKLDQQIHYETEGLNELIIVINTKLEIQNITAEILQEAERMLLQVQNQSQSRESLNNCKKFLLTMNEEQLSRKQELIEQKKKLIQQQVGNKFQSQLFEQIKFLQSCKI